MQFRPVRFKSGILMKRGGYWQFCHEGPAVARWDAVFLTHYIMLLISPEAISHHAPADSGLIKTNASTPLPLIIARSRMIRDEPFRWGKCIQTDKLSRR